jgi:uncharacterized membrane protein
MAFVQRITPPNTWMTWVGGAALLIILTAWTMLTPEGVLGKADAVGYAVCHRIPERSFTLPGGRPVAMCARCTGTFLGVLLGLFVPGLLFGRGRAAQFPKVSIVIALFAFSAWWAFDGANSFNHLLPEDFIIPRLYAPTNFLRMSTGTLHGITMGSMILPVFNATLWQDAADKPTIANWKQMAVLVGLGLVTIGLVYTELPVFLYPATLLSAVGTVTILTAIATIMVVTVFGKENEARTPGEAIPLVVMGLVFTMLLVGAIDAARFFVFGTWDGFVIGFLHDPDRFFATFTDFMRILV